MGAFLTALGGKLAETWLSLLVLPGAVYASLAAAGWALGQGHALDAGRLAHRIDRAAAGPAAHALGPAVLLLALLLVASVGAGLLAATLGGEVEALWLGEWPALLAAPARRLAARRAARWDAAHDRLLAGFAEAVRRAGHQTDPPDAAPTPEDPPPDPGALSAALDRVGWERPARPTWMGDRLLAADARVLRAYDLDLASAWPRLWLLLADTPRGEVTAARAALAAAARRAAWAGLYVPLALLWWPAALVAVVAGAAAWRQGRRATEAFAQLVEACVDLYGHELASALGVPGGAPLTRDGGVRVTRALRKGA